MKKKVGFIELEDTQLVREDTLKKMDSLGANLVLVAPAKEFLNTVSSIENIENILIKDIERVVHYANSIGEITQNLVQREISLTDLKTGTEFKKAHLNFLSSMLDNHLEIKSKEKEIHIKK